MIYNSVPFRFPKTNRLGFSQVKSLELSLDRSILAEITLHGRGPWTIKPWTFPYLL
jgi:hypothetical protein